MKDAILDKYPITLRKFWHLLSLHMAMLFSAFAFSQNTRIDSLKNVVSQISEKTRQIDIYLELTKEYKSIDLDSFLFYNAKAEQLSLQANQHRLARIYCNIGLGFIFHSQADSARLYLDKALVILDRQEDKDVRTAVYGNYSFSYQDMGDYEKMVHYNLKAIETAEGNAHNLATLHFNQATIYGGAGLNNLMFRHLKLAYENSLLSKNRRIEGMTLKSLGHYYMSEQKTDSAEYFLKKGLYVCKQTSNPQICYEIKTKLGELYDNLGEFGKALPLLLQAKNHALDRKVPYNVMASNVYLAQHELRKSNYEKAVSYFKEFDNLNAQHFTPELASLAYRDWANAEARLGNHEFSNTLLAKYLTIRDSVFRAENREALASAEAKYQSEKKDKEIAKQQLLLEKSKAKTTLMGLVIGSLLLISALIWILYRQHQKRKNQEILTLKRENELQTMESLMQGEEKERLRIAKELHDGVNGDLSAVKYKLNSLLEINNEIVQEAVIMIDNSCKQVRAISHNLVPPSLKDFNLVEALEDYCGNMDDIHPEIIRFLHLGDLISLEKNQELNIFRIIQELVTNSVRHAKAKYINVQISYREHGIQISVEDDGKGFDVLNEKNKGIGLLNVRSRVDYLGAKIDVVSNEKGTAYTIELET